MQEIYQQSIDNNDYRTLNEIVLKFSYFLELRQYLNKEDFQQIIKNVQYQSINKRQPVIIMPQWIYFFMDKGNIHKKQSLKSEKHIKNRLKTMTSQNNRVYQRVNQTQQPIVCPVQPFDAFQDQNYNRYSQLMYYTQTGKSTLVLQLSLVTLSEKLVQKLKNLVHIKSKFLGDIQEMKALCRLSIATKIHNFQYLYLHFGQILYSESLRSQFVFFIKSGTVQLRDRKKSKRCVINGHVMLGFDRQNDEIVRCVSEKVEFYFIKIQYLLTYFPLLAQPRDNKTKQTQRYNNIPTLNSVDQNEVSPLPIMHMGLSDHAETNDRKLLSRRRYKHRSMDNIQTRGTKNNKRLILRQHFSNYYNEMFQDFSQKKIKQIGYSTDSQQKLNLFNLKILNRTKPNMQKIQSKLKKIKMEKYRECQEILKKNRQMRELSGIGVTVMTDID